ncbi:Aste57867_23714 [Aphanomyces stellatus]|uniref:Aste57867_23714 protein n=1 Tax=Aphanomyces stellatus TaxID=120398 RepID=A0A485LNL7_9STRA|nr:hypothetical protein As57867_023642 [Aphanomyces stellatus]VFU00359.1 Aste57867_23714 [Aphanomyces stellatus]
MGKPDLTNQAREAIIREVFLKSSGNFLARLPNGLGSELAAKYSCTESTIRKLLSRARKQGVVDGNMSFSVANRKKGRCGRKFKFTPEQVKTKLLELPLADRTTLRSISEKTEVKLATLHRYLKHGMFRAHSSTVRPVLTDANKYARLKFAASMVGSDMVLKEMDDVVHLDEKWFYITKVKRTFYLVPGEKEPERKCKSKRFITKVMFLSAVARPRYDEVTGLWWKDKIGTWPFTEKVAAARSYSSHQAPTRQRQSTRYLH